MLYLDTVTPTFRRTCSTLGLLRKANVGKGRTCTTDFATDVSERCFAQALFAADSYEDLMVCWKWAPRRSEPAVIRRLEELKRMGKLSAEQEYTAWLLASPEDLWDLSPEAQSIQKGSLSKARRKLG